MDQAERKLKLPLLIGALPFLLAGIDSLIQGKYFLGIANLLMAATNLLALRFIGDEPDMTGFWIHLANAALACVVGYEYSSEGKTGLPWAWAAAAAAFAAAAVVSFRKARRAEEAEGETVDGIDGVDEVEEGPEIDDNDDEDAD